MSLCFSEGRACDRASVFMLLQGGRFFLLARLLASLLLIVILLKAVHVIGLVLYVVARVLDLCLLGRPSA